MSRACPVCRYENEEHARFCSGCGAKLEGDGAERDPLFGTVVGDRYHIVRVLGEGGMGRVYYAEQPMGHGRRPVALKVIRATAADRQNVARFQRECDLVIQLTHPNTIRFYDFGTLPDGRLYIAMEYVDGRSLADAIAAGPIAVPIVDRWTRQMGGALIEAHRLGMVHRDLKPENVLLAKNPDEGEFVKVCDFGIAMQVGQGARGEITGEGLIIGTPAYMSPEQFNGTPVDARSDVYAVALIVYEMLTGRRPFVAKTPLEWATAHLTKTPPPLDSYAWLAALPDHKREALARALAKDVERRTPSIREFLDEFLGAEGRPSLHHSVAPPRSSEPTAKATPRARISVDPDARTLGQGVEAEPTPIPPRRAMGSSIAVVLAALVVGGAATYVALRRGGVASGAVPTGETASDAGVASVDAGADAGERPFGWMRMLNGEDQADDAANALGPPDGHCARLRPSGKIVLEVTPGVIARADGTPMPELQIIVSDTSGPYRVDIGVERTSEAFVNVAADVIGTGPIDLDQFGVQSFRYVRIKNRARATTVCVDAVGLR